MKQISHSRFKHVASDLLSTADSIMWPKMRDYTRSAEGNAIDNFVNLAGLLGSTPEQVWAVYFTKHVYAVLRWARDGKLDSEDLKGRLADIINYAQLGWGIACAENKDENSDSRQ